MPRNYVKKGYTPCQILIAKVWMNNGGEGNPYNATHDQLRNESEWRCYICTGQSSSVYKRIFEGDNWESTTPLQDYTDKRGRTYKARYVMKGDRYTKSSQCGVTFYEPRHKQALQGKTLAFLVARGDG